MWSLGVEYLLGMCQDMGRKWKKRKKGRRVQEDGGADKKVGKGEKPMGIERKYPKVLKKNIRLLNIECGVHGRFKHKREVITLSQWGFF